MVLATVSLLGACSSDDNTGIAIVTGTVTDSWTGENIAGAVVTIGDKTATTENNGIYRFVGIGSDSNTITASKGGYTDYSSDIQIIGETESFDISMTLLPVGWACGDSDGNFGTILYTSDGGATWARQGSAAQISNVSMMDVYAVDYLNAWAVGGNDGSFVILRTTDGGQNWSRQGQNLSSPTDLLGVSALNNNVAWAVGANGTILYTSDGGENWVSKNNGVDPDAFLQAVSMFNSLYGWAIGLDFNTSRAQIYYTADGGENWALQTADGQDVTYGLIDVTTMSANEALTGGPFTIQKTSDSGETWTEKKILSEHCNGLFSDKATQKAWSAVDYGVVLRSTDGGESWIQVQPNSISESVTGYALMGVSFLGDGKTGAIVGELLTAPGPGLDWGVILHSTDSGLTWTKVPLPLNIGLRKVAFAGSRK